MSHAFSLFHGGVRRKVPAQREGASGRPGHGKLSARSPLLSRTCMGLLTRSVCVSALSPGDLQEVSGALEGAQWPHL